MSVTTPARFGKAACRSAGSPVSSAGPRRRSPARSGATPVVGATTPTGGPAAFGSPPLGSLLRSLEDGFREVADGPEGPEGGAESGPDLRPVPTRGDRHGGSPVDPWLRPGGPSQGGHAVVESPPQREEMQPARQERHRPRPHPRPCGHLRAAGDRRGEDADRRPDTVVGAGHSGAIVSIVGRASKPVFLERVDSRTSIAVSDAIIDRLGPEGIPVHTLKSDNGKEFAGHAAMSSVPGAGFFFAGPYHSWERCWCQVNSPQWRQGGNPRVRRPGFVPGGMPPERKSDRNSPVQDHGRQIGRLNREAVWPICRSTLRVPTSAEAGTSSRTGTMALASRGLWVVAILRVAGAVDRPCRPAVRCLPVQSPRPPGRLAVIRSFPSVRMPSPCISCSVSRIDIQDPG